MPPDSAFPPSSCKALAGLSWPLIVATLTYLGFFAAGHHLLGDPDTYWHVAAGRWMIEHGAIPSHDPFSSSMHGAPWTAHEWLAEITLALAYRAGGWAGAVALTAFSFAVAMALLTRFLLRTLEPAHVLIFAAFAAMLAAPHLCARPHVLAMPLMVIWMNGMVRASEEGRAPSPWLLPVMTLWANLHGSFTLGLALAAAFALEAALAARRRGETGHAVKIWGGFIVLALFAALLTPNGIQGIAFTAKIFSSSYALDVIGEWQPASFHGIQPLEIWLMVGLAAALHQGWRLPPIRLALLLGFLHLALQHARNIELLGLLLPLLVAAPLAAQWRQQAQAEHQAAGMDRIFQALARPAHPAAISVIAAILALSTLIAGRAEILQPNAGITPAKAVAAARKANAAGPVLNAYNFGGYLIFAGIPPYIDGRADLYGDAFLKEMMEATSGTSAERLAKLLQKRHIGWTLLSANTAAVELLDHLPGWRRLYADEVAVVHVRVPPGMHQP